MPASWMRRTTSMMSSFSNFFLAPSRTLSLALSIPKHSQLNPAALSLSRNWSWTVSTRASVFYMGIPLLANDNRP